jgi:Protein of unknown function (DUF4236)
LGFRFSRRIKIAPGVRINIGLKGASVSVGPRGASITAGRSGIHGNVGIPGTGLSYRQRLGKPKGLANSSRPSTPPELDTVQMDFDDNGILVLKDGAGHALDGESLVQAKKLFNAQIVAFGQRRATEINAEADRIAQIHHDTPPAANPIQLSTYPISKPIKPSDPRDAPAGSAERAAKEEVWSDYMERLAGWRAAKADFERLNEAAPVDAARYQQSLEQSLASLPWPRETFISMEIAGNGTRLLVDVDLPELEDMPNTRLLMDARKLALAEQTIDMREIKRTYSTHVHGVIFRIVGQAFASSPVLTEVKIAGYTQRLSPATGAIADIYVIEARVPRMEWSKIVFSNLAAVDPVAALGEFDVTASIDAQGVMRAINPTF